MDLVKQQRMMRGRGENGEEEQLCFISMHRNSIFSLKIDRKSALMNKNSYTADYSIKTRLS